VLNDRGSGTTSFIVKSIEMVGDLGTKPTVISMSIGSWNNAVVYTAAVDYAVDRGVTVVVSAGNNYADACLKAPAVAANAITTGSTAQGDKRSGFSNFGTCVDIFAPGSSIISADANNSKPGNASTSKSGTSMACPHVAGAAAILLSMNSSLTPADVLKEMRKTVSKKYLTDLSPKDRNELLYVGSTPEAEGNATQGEWPSDEFFESCRKNNEEGPNYDFGACRCVMRKDQNEGPDGTECYEGDKKGCPIGPEFEKYQREQAPHIEFKRWYYLWNCTTCRCLTEAGANPLPVPTTEAPGSLLDPLVLPLFLGAGGTLFLAMALGYFFYMKRNQGGGNGDMEAELAQEE